MAKIYGLDSENPAYTVAHDQPKSLKYYLSAGLHHRLVGRFATVLFFSKDSRPTKENKVYMTDNNRQEEQSQSQSNSNEDKNRKKIAAGGFYSPTTEPGPFANYAEADDKPDYTREVVKLSKEVLASANTVFPFDPFPDSIILDRTTLNITKRTFFFSNDTLSIRIEDILNAHVNVGPFLGSLTIASRVLSSEDHFTVNNLWRKDAIHLKHMIQGYIIALHNEIKISHLSKEDLIETIRELGHDLNS